MGNYNVGDMIRLSRIAKKMTQEELSEGVCSVETLSRIENGKHKVKSDTYRQLMEKMYQITEKNYAVCVSRDMELIEEREYFEDAMAKHDFEKADFYMEQMKKLLEKTHLHKDISAGKVLFWIIICSALQQNSLWKH